MVHHNKQNAVPLTSEVRPRCYADIFATIEKGPNLKTSKNYEKK